MLHAGFVKFSLRNYFNHNQKELSMLHFLTIECGREMTKNTENQVKKGNKKMLFISKLMG